MGIRGASSKTIASTAAPTSPTVTASPFTYQNTSTGPQNAMVSGGTVTVLEYSRDGTVFYPVGLLGGIVSLNPNDKVRVTYAVAPAVTVIQVS